ncbi:MAG: hypothetical protein R3264_17225 [Anaerolineae bacterium]|nr:hypothetical protein [Anaerolineae bacterium]
MDEMNFLKSLTPEKIRALPLTSIGLGMLMGGSFGIIAVLFFYFITGAFIGVMVGSGFYGLLVVIPVMALIAGGIPGAALGGIAGIIFGRFKG